MSELSESRIVRIRNASDINIDFPSDLSFFSPHLSHYVKEILGIGGEAYMSKSSDDTMSGLFIYDDAEKTGTSFTRSRNVFDYFYKMRQFNSLFAELRTEHECETYDIYAIDLDNRGIDHSFSHEISVAEHGDVREIEHFMALTHPGINRKWVGVALDEGDKCFIVRLGNEIGGLGWLSSANRIGRLHSLYVNPQFRGIGIGLDILYARLIWLKSMRASSAFSEISRENLPSSRIALKGGMSVSGQVFQYFKKDPSSKTANPAYRL